MENLPNEILLLIFEYLDIKEKMKLMLTCKKYFSIKHFIYFAIFSTYTEDEGNIICEFIGLTTSIINGKLIIKKLENSSDNISPCHPSMNNLNNYTYIGKRINVCYINNNRRRYRSKNGFIIEPIELNKIYKSGNI